jgi:shikimate kinase
VAAARRPRDLAALPPNDLASSPLSDRLRELGAFRADVSGAGPAVYGLFHHRRQAVSARRALGRGVRTWLTVPVWYG